MSDVNKALVEAARRLNRYDWQDWTHYDLEDAAKIVAAFVARAAAQGAGPSDDYRRGAEDAAAKLCSMCPKCGGEGWLWGHELVEPPDVEGPDDTRYSCDSEVHEYAAAIRALTPPGDAPARWTPPEDRPEGYRCLCHCAVCDNWHIGVWSSADDWTIAETGEYFTVTAFHPLPPSPEDAP